MCEETGKQCYDSLSQVSKILKAKGSIALIILYSSREVKKKSRKPSMNETEWIWTHKMQVCVSRLQVKHTESMSSY